jgi:hypothetical protein
MAIFSLSIIGTMASSKLDLSTSFRGDGVGDEEPSGRDATPGSLR